MPLFVVNYLFGVGTVRATPPSPEMGFALPGLEDRKSQGMTLGLSRFRCFCNGNVGLGLEKWQPC